MCRGCIILKNGESATDEYLDWLDEYHRVVWSMKRVEKKLLDYKKGLDKDTHRKAVDTMHKAAIKVRKQYAGLDSLLNDV